MPLDNDEQQKGKLGEKFQESVQKTQEKLVVSFEFAKNDTSLSGKNFESVNIKRSDGYEMEYRRNENGFYNGYMRIGDHLEKIEELYPGHTDAHIYLVLDDIDTFIFESFHTVEVDVRVNGLCLDKDKWKDFMNNLRSNNPEEHLTNSLSNDSPATQKGYQF